MVEGSMGAGHFIFIPAVLLVGIVIGWILGSRAARDAFAAELRRESERRAAGLRLREPGVLRGPRHLPTGEPPRQNVGQARPQALSAVWPGLG